LARDLDAMWAREPTEVRGNLREVKKLLEKGSVLDYALESLLVPAGPFRLRDDQQMSVASTLMLRSLDYGQERALRSVRHRASYEECCLQPVEGIARWSDGVGDDAGYNKADHKHVSYARRDSRSRVLGLSGQSGAS